MIDETDNINRQKVISALKYKILNLEKTKEAVSNQIQGFRRAVEILEDQKQVKINDTQ